MKGPGPQDWARIAGRAGSARAQRRAAEAMARKASVPALKKMIRRNQQRQGK